ncbi:MAG: TraR/DksA C4-type zinc finger protein [Caldilineaceae bacterium]|nr:TraR/DksA C4-type zinc finger protein [Caldilineaceae bacterium]
MRAEGELPPLRLMFVRFVQKLFGLSVRKVMENTMSTKLDLKKVRSQLMAGRKELLAKLEEKDRDARGENPGRGDLAYDYTNRDRVTALRSVEEQTLEQIDAALERLDAGTYGICSHCGKPINEERMEALPYATLCMECTNQQA